MDAVAGGGVEQYVLAVPIPQAHNVPDHGPDCRCVRVRHPSPEPCHWLGEGGDEPSAENRREHGEDLGLEHLVLRHLSLALVVYALDLRIRLHSVELAAGYVDILQNVAKPASVGHPLHHPAVLREGDDGKGADVEVPPAALGEFGEQTVDHCGELHHPCIFPEVVLRLAKKRPVDAVAPNEDDLEQ